MNINLTDDASSRLQHLIDSMEGGRTWLMKRLGQRGSAALRAHFADREKEPNAKGWPKQHFWARIRRATAFVSADNDSATIAVADPAFAHKIDGGTVRPKKTGGALAIPLRAAAYGISPRSRSIEGLFVLRSRIMGRAFLARKEGEKLTLYYILLKSVTHKKDPRALPDMSALSEQLANRAEELISQKLADKD